MLRAIRNSRLTFALLSPASWSNAAFTSGSTVAVTTGRLPGGRPRGRFSVTGHSPVGVIESWCPATAISELVQPGIVCVTKREDRCSTGAVDKLGRKALAQNKASATALAFSSDQQPTRTCPRLELTDGRSPMRFPIALDVAAKRHHLRAYLILLAVWLRVANVVSDQGLGGSNVEGGGHHLSPWAAPSAPCDAYLISAINSCKRYFIAALNYFARLSPETVGFYLKMMGEG